MNAKDYLKKPYSRVLIAEEDGGYSAKVLEFSGCFAEGDTIENAARNIENAAECWLMAAIDGGNEIPEPINSYKNDFDVILRDKIIVVYVEVGSLSQNDACVRITRMKQELKRITAKKIIYIPMENGLKMSEFEVFPKEVGDEIYLKLADVIRERDKLKARLKEFEVG